MITQRRERKLGLQLTNVFLQLEVFSAHTGDLRLQRKHRLVLFLLQGLIGRQGVKDLFSSAFQIEHTRAQLLLIHVFGDDPREDAEDIRFIYHDKDPMVNARIRLPCKK
ncbi:hypothetical protein PsorP6_010786 [Peronosclerospora sorghi]|uniref:Uncharacterized protein n=1 Tax=Peronosclerospora sorghi TaxID=230839 RepID=A0ACC0VTX5_9STRA|nr:hypothetical protein PsorP6_010786 [Peronosclerospora sorghi]